MMSVVAAATRRVVLSQGRRSLSFYSPTLTERRVGEAGTGGRNSEAGLKVAVFGASGFLGSYVCAELGESVGVEVSSATYVPYLV